MPNALPKGSSHLSGTAGFPEEAKVPVFLPSTGHAFFTPRKRYGVKESEAA
jgi:hypothetical protein